MHLDPRFFVACAAVFDAYQSAASPLRSKKITRIVQARATNLTGDNEELSLQENVNRGLIRARVTYPGATLLRMQVRPEKLFPAADPKWLISELKLYMRDEPQDIFLIEPANDKVDKWGEWQHPLPVESTPGRLNVLEWSTLKLDVEAAASKCVEAGFDGSWLKVLVQWPEGKDEPEWQFWQSRFHISRRYYPRYVIVTAMTGEVTPVWADNESPTAANVTFS